jgi:hypothetical protein
VAVLAAEREAVLRPGLFSVAVSADARRGEFDAGNESLRLAGVRPDLLLIGASIMHCWELHAYFAAPVLVNRGISGDSSPWVRRRFAADALQLRPKLIAMQVGALP